MLLTMRIQGAMGSALLHGLLDSCTSESPDFSFVACTKTSKSAVRLAESLNQQKVPVRVAYNEPVRLAKDAEVIVLGFKPYMTKEVFDIPGFLDLLEGKLVISLLAALTCVDLRNLVLSHDDTADKKRNIHFARAIPTMACRRRQSMSVLEISSPALSPEHSKILEWMFERVGKIQYLPPNLMNIGSMLATASLAAISIPVEGLMDGAVAEGLRRSDAKDLVVQGLRGLVAMLENGEHPANLREVISSPRGGTIQSLITIERAGVRGVFADAVINGSRQFSKPM